ncbi:MAG: DUF3761 domain-containing protein [Methylocella sp.]
MTVIVMVICRDGEKSFSEHRSGKCSGHGGVETWRLKESGNGQWSYEHFCQVGCLAGQ